MSGKENFNIFPTTNYFTVTREIANVQDLGDISYVICEFDEDISGELFQNEYEIKQ